MVRKNKKLSLEDASLGDIVKKVQDTYSNTGANSLDYEIYHDVCELLKNTESDLSITTINDISKKLAEEISEKYILINKSIGKKKN